jgi:DNA mismatch endonuclease (patch repair protein)
MDRRTKKEKRSFNMSRIRGKDTAPELRLRRALHAAGLRYRLHGKGMPGRPDLVFRKRRAVVFVHGCFWHRHEGCIKTTTPSSNVKFWADKFSGTKKRDAAVVERLRADGWRVAIVWECRLTTAAVPETAAELSRWLITSADFLEIG